VVSFWKKKTLIRKCIKDNLQSNPQLSGLLPHVRGNVGFVFTNNDLATLRTKISTIKVKSPAKAGAIAPCDVIVPAGPTGQDPAKTSFFHALSIPTRIAKSVIEIASEVHLIKVGAKVTASQAALLQMLNIQPFEYALVARTVYDEGWVYPAALLDITDEDVLERFQRGVSNIAALSLRIGYPTAASIPYTLTSSFRNLLAVCLATNYTFPQAEKLKDLLANPEKLSAALAAAAPTTAASESAATQTTSAPAPTPAKVEEEEEEDMDAGGLFGGGDDDY